MSWWSEPLAAVGPKDNGERGLHAALDHPAFPLDQLKLAEPEQVLDMILALGRTLAGKLGVLGLEGGQLELPEMVLEEHLWRVVHAAVPDIRLR